MEHKFTPGPWRSVWRKGHVIVGAGGYNVGVIGYVWQRPIDKKINAANARLVSAAPDLLSALETLLMVGSFSGDEGHVAANKARSEIAKAVRSTAAAE